jgi:hypothetical protein
MPSPDPVAPTLNSERVEFVLARYRAALGADLPAYRGHVYRVISYAMHFLGADERHRALVETAFAYHDIALWTDRELAYLEPSEVLALRDNATEAWGLDPDLLQDAIHWHHKITPYRGPGAQVVNAVRKADWIDASGGLLRQGLSREQVAAVEAAIPRLGFDGVLQRLALELGGSTLRGNLRVLRRVFKL